MSDEIPTEQEIRGELGKTYDQLHALPSDAFAEKSRLRARQDALGCLLRDIEIPGAAEIEQRWSDLAGSKADPNEVKPIIVSPMESGGGGGV